MENTFIPLHEKSIHPYMEYSTQLCFPVSKRILFNLKICGLGINATKNQGYRKVAMKKGVQSCHFSC